MIVIGLNFRTADVALREKFSFSTEDIHTAFSEIKKDARVDECLILSTCNRTEFYVCTKKQDAISSYIQNFICTFKTIDPARMLPHFYHYHNDDAVRHLFKVISGLDSMMLGENQIFGQVKDAYAESCNCKMDGIIINRLLTRAFRVGKRVRTETQIAAGTVSISSAATELAEKIFTDLSKRTALLIGAGEMGELTATHLNEKQIGKLFIANRTFSKAEELAKTMDATTIAFEEIDDTLKTVDVVISATSAKEVIVTSDRMKKIMSARNHRPLFIIDIAIPRDFDPTIDNIYNVFLHSIDDLQKIVDKNLIKRKMEIPKVLSIAEEELANFLKWKKSLALTPIITQLQKRIEAIRLDEIAEGKKYFKSEEEKYLDLVTKSMMNKLLNPVLIKLKEFNDDSELALTRLDTIKEIFNLTDDEDKNNDNR